MPHNCLKLREESHQSVHTSVADVQMSKVSNHREQACQDDVSSIQARQWRFAVWPNCFKLVCQIISKSFADNLQQMKATFAYSIAI